MKIILNLLLRLKYKLLYGKKLQIGKNVTLSHRIDFIIDGDKHSCITIGDNSIVRDLVELRATKGAKLIIEANCKVDKLVRIIATNGKNINIGKNSRIGIGSVFNGGESITLSENCLVSGYVYIQTSMHNHKGTGDIIDNGYTYSPIHIGKGCWLGVHSVIFPGVNLSNRCVVGSNAVVNRSFSSNKVIGGIPATELKNETKY